MKSNEFSYVFLSYVLTGLFVFWALPSNATLQSGTHKLRGSDSFQVADDLSQASELNIENSAGSVSVRPSDIGKFSVIANTSGSSAAYVGELFITADPGKIRIRVVPAQANAGQIDLVIQVPENQLLTANIRTDSGSVRISGFTSNSERALNISTNSGATNIADMYRHITAISKSGNIEAFGSVGNIACISGCTGSVKVFGQVGGGVKARTDGGSIMLDNRYAHFEDVKSSSGLVMGQTEGLVAQTKEIMEHIEATKRKRAL